MFSNIPLAILFGILALLSFVITLSLGVARSYFKKNFFKYHRIFAYLTIIFVIIHLAFAILLWYFGIVV